MSEIMGTKCSQNLDVMSHSNLLSLGPIHLLNSLIDDILALETEKSYLRKETRMSQIVSKNINKSTATEGFEKSNGEK